MTNQRIAIVTNRILRPCHHAAPTCAIASWDFLPVYTSYVDMHGSMLLRPFCQR